MHPGLILGKFIPEFSLSGKHKIYQQYGNGVNQNNLDGIPESGDAFCPVHGVKLKYLIQLLTSPLYFCSKACKLQFLLEIQIMTKGTTFHAFIPIRFEPGNTSVMISQLLFGEEFTLKERSHNWLSISLDFDGTEGWVAKEFVELREIENGEETSIDGPVCLASLPSSTILDLTLGQQRIIPAGAAWNSERNNSMFWYGHSFELLSGEGFITPGASNNLREIGKRLVSLPQLPGGRSGFGFDGPGLVQLLNRMMGKNIPRYCQQQVELGNTINFMTEVKEGDLAFFDNEESEIIHVGIILDDGNILHCDTCVCIDLLDHHGIYKNEQEKYTHKLRVIKRI
jgi:hypothetical protein